MKMREKVLGLPKHCSDTWPLLSVSAADPMSAVSHFLLFSFCTDNMIICLIFPQVSCWRIIHINQVCISFYLSNNMIKLCQNADNIPSMTAIIFILFILKKKKLCYRKMHLKSSFISLIHFECYQNSWQPGKWTQVLKKWSDSTFFLQRWWQRWQKHLFLRF